MLIKKSKKAVSLMISYVILISIAITMAITVFAWLKIIANVEPVKSCEEETSIAINDYSCDGKTFNLIIKNNGRFSVHGLIVTVGDDPGKAPITRLIPTNANEISNEGYFSFNNGLKPGEIRNASFSNKAKKNTIQLVDFDFIRNVKVQPYIIDQESNKKIVCENIIKQSIENCNMKNVTG